MTSQIQFLHMKNHEWMENFVQEKLQKLESRYAWITHANLLFKIESAASTNNNICEIELSVPGPKLFAKARANSFEMSVNKTISELDRLLKKKKAKMYRH